jgi:hypothetical protein
MSNFSKPAWNKYILNPSFKYIPSASTDIRDTFRRARIQLNSTAKNQDNNKPLVGPQNNNLDKPLVLNPGAFVLPVEWFNIED